MDFFITRSCPAQQGSNLQSSVNEYLVSAFLQNKFTLDFFFTRSCPAQQGSNLQSSVFHMQSSAIRLEIEEMGRSDMSN
jgi:hypothetical protein